MFDSLGIPESFGNHLRNSNKRSDGLEQFQNGRFDVVITDLDMPGLRGDKLAAALRDTSPETPVIMLTARGQEMLAKGEKPAGVTLVLPKPFSFSTIRDAIQRISPSPSMERNGPEMESGF